MLLAGRVGALHKRNGLEPAGVACLVATHRLVGSFHGSFATGRALCHCCCGQTASGAGRSGRCIAAGNSGAVAATLQPCVPQARCCSGCPGPCHSDRICTSDLSWQGTASSCPSRWAYARCRPLLLLLLPLTATAAARLLPWLRPRSWYRSILLHKIARHAAGQHCLSWL